MIIKAGILLNMIEVYTQTAMSFDNRNCYTEILIVSKY